MINTDINIRIVNPNKNKTIETVLSDIIAYKLANKKMKETQKNT